jgi:spoIIIJ-associated protein
VREVERSGASVEEALEAALDELGISEQEAEVEIVQEPRGGFLGVGSQEALVRVRARGTPSPGAAPDAGDVGELEHQADVAADFLEGLIEIMALEAEVEPASSEGVPYVDVWGAESADAMGILIGKHGQTLDALQEIVRGVVQRQLQERCRVIVDVEDYRKRRRSLLVSRAQGVARRVKKTGRPERLEPMTAFERKTVHDAVAEVGGVQTTSEGEEPERRVVVRRAGLVSRETERA